MQGRYCYRLGRVLIGHFVRSGFEAHSSLLHELSFSIYVDILIIKRHLVGLGISISESDHEVTGSIPSTSTNFKCRLGLEWGPTSLMRTIG